MQFKHPEFLWALFLLLIPIFIHLFQLRRFKRTPFTNVKLLQQVVSKSRKSSTLKKWLLLFSRLGILTGLVLAFAQPFSASENAVREKENVFYLDNSFSMHARTANATLFQNTVQEFIQRVPEDEKFHLFTNDNTFLDVEINDLKNDLLEMKPSAEQLTLKEVVLKAKTLHSQDNSKQRNTIIISDFQQRLGDLPNDSIATTNLYYINPLKEKVENIAIDSIYLNPNENGSMDLTALVSSNYSLETTAVSLYNGDKLIAKTAANFDTNNKAKVLFSIPSDEKINGRIVLADNGLTYDNEFYFNINAPEQIKVLDIGTTPNYLKRIFIAPQFQYQKTNLNQLNYGALETYNLIVLNELTEIPSGLVTALRSFTDDGGSLAIIPGQKIDLAAYNRLLSFYFNTTFDTKINQEVAIFNITFEHPLYYNVFQKNVSNFQYPTVKAYYPIRTNTTAALSLQNKAPFLVGRDNVYMFAASLEDTNFKNSPLIVPTFYNIGANSLKSSELYHVIGKRTQVDVPYVLNKDNVLKLLGEDYEFIPQQRALPKKTRLLFDDNPAKSGVYQILDNDQVLRNISFNYDRKESDLSYLELGAGTSTIVSSSIADFFETSQKENTINEFWKWFAILALLFVFIETILQRFLK